MARDHRPDREAAAAECRFVVESGDEDEAVEPARTRVLDVHRNDFADGKLRSEHLTIV